MCVGFFLSNALALTLVCVYVCGVSCTLKGTYLCELQIKT